MAKFEVVSRFADAGIPIPQRATANSAGYDFIVAEDIDIPSYDDMMHIMEMNSVNLFTQPAMEMMFGNLYKAKSQVRTLEELAAETKELKTKPTLVSTGLKCKLASDEYLQISARSSTPLKYWLVVANAPGIIDADYYNNEANEGEIFIQVINLSPYTIHLNKGDKIAQGIILKYNITEDDTANGLRVGGMGSTGT